MKVNLNGFSKCFCILLLIILNLVTLSFSSIDKSKGTSPASDNQTKLEKLPSVLTTSSPSETSDEFESSLENVFKDFFDTNSVEDPLKNGEFDDSIKFFLFNRTRMDQPITIGKPKTLKNLNKEHSIKILIHGFMGECKGENFPGKLVEAYLQRENISSGKTKYNLICVDWMKLSHFGRELSLLLYKNSIENAVIVGKRLALFIKFLIDHNVTSLNKLHIIGYSLGAHCAGIAGYYLHRYYNEKVGRISGLDPAGPFYDKQTMVHQLDESDADFVDVLHTNSGKLGISKKVGHVDFFPNGGRNQPQCLETGDPTVDLYEKATGLCSHQIAPSFYSKSILNSSIKACNCMNTTTANGKPTCETCEDNGSKLIFGEFCPTGTTGNYYLELI